MRIPAGVVGEVGQSRTISARHMDDPDGSRFRELAGRRYDPCGRLSGTDRKARLLLSLVSAASTTARSCGNLMVRQPPSIRTRLSASRAGVMLAISAYNAWGSCSRRGRAAVHMLVVQARRLHSACGRVDECRQEGFVERLLKDFVEARGDTLMNAVAISPAAEGSGCM
jgi:hypothetical protein